MFPNRPKAGEDEEEIMAQEKQFLQNAGNPQKFQPAATAVRTKSGQKPTAETKQLEAEDEESGDEIINETTKLEQPVEIVLMSNVMERSFDPSKLLDFKLSKPPTMLSNELKKPIGKSFFAQKLSKSSSDAGPSAKKHGKSLFAQMFDAKYGEEGETNDQSDLINAGDNVIGDKIHPYLAGMTEQEILAEQKKLLERLDPKLVEFIKSRNKGKGQTTNVETCVKLDNVKQESEMRMSCEEPLNTSSELPIDPIMVKGIPGMENVEFEKLQWTGLVKENRPKHNKLKEGEIARFDFDGNLLTGDGSLDDAKTFEKGLHHHGEEMEKPGYSMEELLTLSRSLNNQQKALALQIIGNIYAKAHTGMYDLIFESSLFELSEYMDFVYAVRKALDEGNKTVVNKAIQCLANIVYPWEEEICLDVVCSWEHSKPHPWISTKLENVNLTLEPDDDERDMKDFEMLKMDLLEFLIYRSNLLDRLTFILQDDSLAEVGVQTILKILIRVARHSPTTLLDHDELVKTLVENYTNPNWSGSISYSSNLKGVPLWMVFKLLRILADSSSSNALKIYKNLQIFPTLLAYLTYDGWNENLSEQRPDLIVIESLRIWIALISQGVAIDEYTNFFPVLMKFLILYQKMDEMSSFDLMHSGYMFSLLLSILTMSKNMSNVQNTHSHWTLVKDCIACVERVIIKLLSIISSAHLDSTYDEGAMFWSLSRGLLLLSESVKYDPECLSRGLISSLNSFLSTQIYERITSQLEKRSIILMAKDGDKIRYPSNFASVNSVLFGGNCNPVIIFGTALPFLSALFNIQKHVPDNLIPLSSLLNKNTQNYIQCLLKSKRNQTTMNFFVRFELSFILAVAESYPSKSSEQFYLAYKAVSETPKCCTELFNSLFKIAVTTSCDDNEVEMCYKIYGGYLIQSQEQNLASLEPVKSNDTDDNVPRKKVKFSEDTKAEDGAEKYELDFKKWDTPSIESHWILEPMHKIHTIVTTMPGFLSKNLDKVEIQCRICLQLIEKCLQHHCDFVIRTSKDLFDVYNAVCQVFLLGDPRIYIGNEIDTILTRILKALINCRVVKESTSKQIFSNQRQISGHPNMFFDLYRDLVKEYSENSYFNPIFGQYLLIPLRIPEDSKLKSEFWIMDTLRFFRISITEALIPVEYLTTGVEKDARTLSIFLNLIGSEKITETQNSFLFSIIKTVLQMSLTNLSDEDDNNLISLRDSFNKLKL